MLETYLERSFLFETCKCQLVELATIDTIASTTLQQDIEVHAVKILHGGNLVPDQSYTSQLDCLVPTPPHQYDMQCF